MPILLASVHCVSCRVNTGIEKGVTPIKLALILSQVSLQVRASVALQLSALLYVYHACMI